MVSFLFLKLKNLILVLPMNMLESLILVLLFKAISNKKETIETNFDIFDVLLLRKQLDLEQYKKKLYYLVRSIRLKVLTLT